MEAVTVFLMDLGDVAGVLLGIAFVVFCWWCSKRRSRDKAK